MASLFSATDTPVRIMHTVRSCVTGGRLEELAADPQLVAKLRMVGVYDDRQDGFFMLRTRVPGGHLSARQADVIGRVAEEFCARPAGFPDEPDRFLEITTRQDVQLHWVRLADLDTIWRIYEEAGLTSLQACGDTARNVTGCPVSGIDPNEVIEGHPHVQALTDHVIENPEYGAFFPRKFKTALTGCTDDCILAGINDLAFTPAERDGERGFSAWVGGGLSDYPRLASRLDLFIPPGRVIDVASAVIKVFKDLGNYEDKAVNRFRRLVAELGHDRIEEEVAGRLSAPLPPAGAELTVAPRFDHVGIHDQRQPGLQYVGLAVPVGRMRGHELRELTGLAAGFGDGSLRLTPRQDVIIPGVPAGRVAELVQAPLLQRFSPAPRPFARSVVACTSAPFCKFGIANVKQHGLELAQLLDAETSDGYAGPIRLHVSGCKASCAQIQIADIGLRATMAKDEQSYQEAFDIVAGGDLAAGRLGQWVALEVPAPAVREGLLRMVRTYEQERAGGDSFATFLRDRGTDWIRAIFEPWGVSS